jgi:hypothetical protein
MSVLTGKAFLNAPRIPAEADPQPSLISRLLSWVGIRIEGLRPVQPSESFLDRLGALFAPQRTSSYGQDVSILPLMLKDQIAESPDLVRGPTLGFFSRVERGLRRILRLGNHTATLHNQRHSQGVLNHLEALHSAARLKTVLTTGADLDPVNKLPAIDLKILSQWGPHFSKMLRPLLNWLERNPDFDPKLTAEIKLALRSIDQKVSHLRALPTVGSSPLNDFVGLEGGEITDGAFPYTGMKNTEMANLYVEYFPLLAESVTFFYSVTFQLSKTMEETIDTFLIFTYILDYVGRCVGTLIQNFQLIWLKFINSDSDWSIKEAELSFLRHLEDNPTLAEALNATKGLSTHAKEWLSLDELRQILETTIQNISGLAGTFQTQFDPQALTQVIEKIKLDCCKIPAISDKDISAVIWDGLGSVQRDIETLASSISELTLILETES